MTELAHDAEHMRTAIRTAWQARHRSAPNPWVGALLVQTDGQTFAGSTEAYGGAHAEVVALRQAPQPQGATLYTTLEPCDHMGRTGPCTEAIIRAGVARLVLALQDPDPQVSGAGIKRLRRAGVAVLVGVGAPEVQHQLRPYLHHRLSGLPYVVLKLASTLDGRSAATDATSQWITGRPARVDAHKLRAYSSAIVVGAGTVRVDDPALTVRLWPVANSSINCAEVTDPLRVVLGSAPKKAKAQPCLSWTAEVTELLYHLGERGAIQVLVEGGASVAQSFHQAGLVDQYVLYLAAALMGGDDGTPLFRGTGAKTINEIWRGQLENVQRLGDDLRIDVLKSSR